MDYAGVVHERMKRVILLPTVLSVVMIVGLFPAALATHFTPFNGSMSGNGTATSTTTNSITATVHLNHFGKSRLVGVTTVTGTTGCGGFVGTEKDTITSADGEQVFVSGNGTSCMVRSSPPEFQDTVSFTIIGGTGRFADASGSGTVHTTIIITSPTGDSSFAANITGTITY